MPHATPEVHPNFQSDGSTDAHSLDQPKTPDGRYFVVKGRLWRLSNPALSVSDHEFWVAQLMAARRQISQALKSQDKPGEKAARAAVDAAKRALGERGPVWWTDGAPDFNRRLVNNTPYRIWYDARAADV